MLPIFYLTTALFAIAMFLLLFSKELRTTICSLSTKEHYIVLVDEEDAQLLLDKYGYCLKEVYAASPFQNGIPILVEFRDRLGRPVVTKVRWINTTYYYVDSYWLSLIKDQQG